MPNILSAPPGPMYKGKQPRLEWYPEAANQTFKEGDWVYLVGGKLTLAAAPNNDVGNIKLAGRVCARATGVTDTKLPIEIGDDDYEVLFPIYHGTAASAVTAVTDPTLDLPLRNQGGIWVLNKETDGTNDRIAVKSIDPRYPVGERYGWVWGKVLAAHRQLG